MANVNHSALTDPYLHEPKGVAAAPAGARYYSDGAGSGNWTRIQGWGQFADADTTVGSPSQNIATGARTLWTNDGLTTNIQKSPSDLVSPLWNTSTNKITPIAAFDTYNIRIGFKAENYAGTGPDIKVELDIGGGIGVIVSTTVPLLRSGAQQSCLVAFPVFAGTTFIANGGSVYLTYTGTGTCDIFGGDILIVRESKNYV